MAWAQALVKGLPRAQRAPRYRLYAERFGEGRTAVCFLPGLGGTSRYFHPRLAAAVGGARSGLPSPVRRAGGLQSQRIVCLDPLGFGRSPIPWGRYTLERHSDAVHRTLDEEPSRIVLVGHSFGSILATRYAVRHPERVVGLVLIGLPYYPNPGGARAYLARQHWMAGVLTRSFFLSALACVVTRHLLARLIRRFMPQMPPEVIEDALRHSWNSFASTLWRCILGHDVGSDFDRLPPDLPVLLIHGERDRTAPFRTVRTLAERRPDWRLRSQPDTGHHIFLTHLDWTLDQIDGFVAEVTRSGAAEAGCDSEAQALQSDLAAVAWPLAGRP